MTEKNHPLDTTPLPRAQPCMGIANCTDAVFKMKDGKIKKYRLEFDREQGIWWPKEIVGEVPQHEHGDPQ